MNNLRFTFLAGAALVALSVSPALAQQPYVSRYDAYVGFTDLNSPDLGLNQPGFHTQVGLNPRTWMSVGFDYSWSKGTEVLTTGLLPAALQQQIGAAEAYYQSLGALPANYRLAVPTDATTQTFALGPQLAFRHFAKVTFFARPSLGALRERAVPHPTDAFSTIIAAQLAPAGFKRDWAGFYGIGGGADYSLTRSFGLRMQLDAVHDHPFNDILANGRWTYRFAVGPSFHFGRNIVGEKSVMH
jgi:hypothetical protein